MSSSLAHNERPKDEGKYLGLLTVLLSPLLTNDETNLNQIFHLLFFYLTLIVDLTDSLFASTNLPLRLYSSFTTFVHLVVNIHIVKFEKCAWDFLMGMKIVQIVCKFELAICISA